MFNATRSDDQLLNQIRHGDVAALGALYDRYHLMIFHIALAITRDRRAAEEVLQQCFLELYAQAGELHSDQPIAPWLYRRVIELGRTRLAHRASRWLPVESVLDRFDRLMTPSSATADVALNPPEVDAKLHNAMESLPFKQRIVLILFYLGGLSLKEIALILDRPLGTVKSRLHYGRERLREQLADHQATAPTPRLEVAYDLNP
jgi:RNA polymerase sigma-70 factor (ECF subfamily)